MWTAFTVFVQPLAVRVNPVQLSALTMSGGVLPLLIATPKALAATDWSLVGPAAWAALLYASVISMVIAYLFWYRGLRVLGPTANFDLRKPSAGDCNLCCLAVSPRGTDNLAGSWNWHDHDRHLSDTLVRIVLFDIDGTLLRSGGVGRIAMERALTTVFGSPGSSEYRYDGKTDRQIVRDLMRREGFSDEAIDEQMDQLLGEYVSGLKSELASGTRNVLLLEGVRELLDALEQQEKVVIGLLTEKFTKVRERSSLLLESIRHAFASMLSDPIMSIARSSRQLRSSARRNCSADMWKGIAWW
jgi:hypothetical protein